MLISVDLSVRSAWCELRPACPASVHLLPGLDEKRWCQHMRQRREAKRAVFLGLGRDLFQLCRPPSPTSERRRCFPGSASRPAPPLPLVRGFPALRVLPADPTSTTTSAFLWMVRSVGLLDHLPVKTVVDLPGSVTLPFLSVPCSQTPPESPTPSPFTGAYCCLPGLRPCRPPDYRVTRLNRFTCVTAWTSLGLRLTHVVASMSPRLDSWWGGSLPLPGREFHPLEAPGLAWRTEKAADIGVQNVVHLLLQERIRQRIQRIMLAAPRAKSIRESEKVFLVNLVEDGDHGLLDNFVFHGRDPQWTLPPIFFLYVHSPRRLRSIRRDEPDHADRRVDPPGRTRTPATSLRPPPGRLSSSMSRSSPGVDRRSDGGARR